MRKYGYLMILLFLTACAAPTTLFDTVGLRAEQVESISYEANIAPVELTEAETAYLLDILENAPAVPADPAETAPELLGTPTAFTVRLKEQSVDFPYERKIGITLSAPTDRGYPATVIVTYSFAEIQRQRESGETNLSEKKTFGFWIGKNEIDLETYENLVLAANDRAHRNAGF